MNSTSLTPRRSLALRPRAPMGPWRARWRHWRARLRLLHRSGELTRRLLLSSPLLAVGFAIWAFGGVYGWAYGSAYLLIYAALAVWCVEWWRGRLPAHWKWIYLPLLGFGLFAQAQAALGWSAVASATVTALVHLGAAGALFLLITQCYRGDADVRALTTVCSLCTGALALLAILQLLTDRQGLYWTFTYEFASPAGSFVNRNHFAGCMEMLLPVACVAAYQRRRLAWLHFLPWAAVPALGVAAVLLSASRGGAAALSTEALAAILILLYLERKRRQTAAGTGRRARRRPLYLMGTLTVGLVLLVGTQALQSRLHGLDASGPDAGTRAQLNRSSWAMFQARPLAGWGLGTWADVYPAFARFNDGNVYLFAHNDYLQLLAETGVVGVCLAGGFWAIWLAAFLDRLRRWPPELVHSPGGAPAAIPLAVACALGCAGLLVHSFVDFNLHIPSNLLLFFTLAALALPPEKAPQA
ncbi:MAG: O-antigen ligase family protein [Terriglobales bacterium]